MKDTCVCLHTLARLALLFALAALFTVSSFAQQDLEIMVSGPWSFVKEPSPHLGATSKRIVLIAPYDLDAINSEPTHEAVFYSGPNASMDYARTLNPPAFSPSDAQNQNIYYVDFPGKTAAGAPPDELRAKPFRPTNSVPDNVQRDAVYAPTAQRYAISLPMPDYVRTYDGYTYGNGQAEGKIGVDVGSATPTHYTTWMVLHYTVKSIPSQMSITVLPKYDPHGHPANFKTVAVQTGTGRSAISLVLMETHPCLDSTNVLDSQRDGLR